MPVSIKVSRGRDRQADKSMLLRSTVQKCVCAESEKRCVKISMDGFRARECMDDGGDMGDERSQGS